MGLWSKGLKKAQTGEFSLVIKDGVLIICKTKEGAIAIPEEVEKVAADAFAGCENVTIDISTAELVSFICLTLRSVEREFKLHPRVVELGEPNPVSKVWNMSTDNVESAIKTAVAKREEQNPEIKWNITIIDADRIVDICREIEKTGRDNIVKIDGEKVTTLFDIPFLVASPINQLGANSDYVNEITDKEGYGILYLKNMNSENVKTLPDNFIYNLVKRHSFFHVSLSSKWVVILECGEGVKLDAPGDIGFIFNGNTYRNIPVAKYMEDMKRQEKIIEPENNKTESTPTGDLEEKESEKSQMNEGS